jgi:uncharacterized membrane protein YgcG
VEYDHGTATAALRHREFRIVWAGTFVSTVGTWMQNVLLGAFVLAITRQPWFVGFTYFALVGPLLVLAPVGGTLADILDRRKLLVWLQIEQLAFSVGLAFLASADRPNKWAILLCALMVGIGNALSAPAIASLLPTMVPREDMHGAVALQAVQLRKQGGVARAQQRELGRGRRSGRSSSSGGSSGGGGGGDLLRGQGRRGGARRAGEQLLEVEVPRTAPAARG